MANKMKCTDSWKLGKQLRNRMMEELKKAIKAHGGSYSWYSEENEEFSDDAPVVMCNHRYAGPVDVKIKNIYLDEWEYINIEAVTEEYGDEIDISFDDIAPGHFSFIIEMIPATSEVEDVSLPSTSAFMLQDDYLEVLQEMTAQAIESVQEKTDQSREECFSIIRTWTDEFLQKTKDFDWQEVPYYDCMDSFIKEKVDSYGRQ